MLGSIYTPALWLSFSVDPYGRANNGAIYNLMQQVPPRNSIRGFIPTQNNAIEYISPLIAGAVTARVMFAPSGQTGDQSRLGQMFSSSLAYDKRPLYVGVSYERSYVNASSLGGSANPRSNTTMTMGAAYTFPWFRASGYLLKNQLSGFNDVNGYMAGITIPIGTSRIVGSYSARQMTHDRNTKASVFAIGYFYPVSKRTTLFTSFAQLHNGASTSFGLWPSETIYNPQGLPVGGQNVRSLELGIAHYF
jgi:predicted porin